MITRFITSRTQDYQICKVNIYLHHKNAVLGDKSQTSPLVKRSQRRRGIEAAVLGGYGNFQYISVLIIKMASWMNDVTYADVRAINVAVEKLKIQLSTIFNRKKDSNWFFVERLKKLKTFYLCFQLSSAWLVSIP